ncbi:K(+)-stimulated pyrophosphate-energized sodium pump [Kineococcus xinjiangensis]|uniref:K(+)-insensitive pyrophosphate-energized proton pump n=1 Tax=Kineococcus xinjiangensis TaxID=512762 RepID=A0A2S6IFF0_9ACTN|nr:sodium-translocating pyrophosphatase [Kineococcus xinjiangensis]PPK92939.1 K(+)-stimulated pyrophosphate-energized sodium pump [Kineococcus xinjiangensis]
MPALTHAISASTTGAATEALSGSSQIIVIGVGVVAVVSLLIAVVFRRQVLAAGEGTESMQLIARAIQEGASAYLRRQFKTLVWFAVAVFGVLFLLPAGDTTERIGRSVAFLAGAGFSAAIGYLGMSLAVKANVRVAAAAREGAGGREEGMRIAFRTGGVVGMATVGLGLLGAAVVVLVFHHSAPTVLEGFGFGAALLAMFMRVGGGIFTKAADVGADLVGKIEQGIPEDDPRNPATIADNVGDNVGDCAGMAADLFESYAVTLVAALILGRAAFGEQGLVLPLIIPAIGALTAMLGVVLVRARPGVNGLVSINRGFYATAAIAVLGTAIACWLYLPGTFAGFEGAPQDVSTLQGNPKIVVLAAVALGIFLALMILWLTGYYTGTDAPPTEDVARTSLTGPATVVLAGIGLGLESAVYTTLVIAGAVLMAFLLAGGTLTLGMFFIALAGCGLLTTVGVIVAMDTFGPVSDNAQGIAEMSGDVTGEGAQILTELDAVGNTTKAVTKGIAIATAVLAATALFGSYRAVVQEALESAVATVQGSPAEYVIHTMARFEIITPTTLVGVLLGAAVVFLFSGLAIQAVGRSAGAVVVEVRRQFREHPGIMTGEEKPEHGRVVDMCTRDALRELATPGLLAVMAPIAVGFGLGVGPLAGFLGGAIASGVLMAVFLSNSGGAWDNAKKIVEDGHYGGKGSEAHAAVVIGDTVGDPFKDTAGPAINPLLKVMNLVALLVAPAVVTLSLGEGENKLLRYGIAVAASAVIVVAVMLSKRRTVDLSDSDEGPGDAVDGRLDGPGAGLRREPDALSDEAASDPVLPGSGPERL